MILIAAAAAAALAAGAFFFLGDDDSGEEGTVVYHGNGGLTADGSDTYEVRGDTVSANDFVNENELFASWNTAADGSGQLFNTGDHIDSGGRIDLYAQWGVTAAFAGTEDRSSIRFYIAEGLGTSSESYQQADGAVPLPNDGSATLLIMGNGRWSYDADTGAFSGRYTSGGTAYTCTLGLEVNGAEISQA
ncbi:InlB B-repeat-containing protein [Candidatus Methanomethylophilus sp. 1R26]|uniref:InlB B-repeat-containing protein n=1 Tax=Candidatus Methanomethylophilus sp. 1R26 TaxID=1769296 RepID=UPI0009EA327E|nr:InlB B-repeat-containing protein [Candidatus Methanomethylophilus sp. 1R26]